jgi:uncharacterized protein (TIGR00299 family) protein
MKTLYFDCFAGISGDMTIGALLDLGVDLGYLQEELKKLPVEGYSLDANRVTRSNVSAIKFDVLLDPQTHAHGGHDHHNHHNHDEHPHGQGHGHAHRKASEILAMIRDSSLNARVKRIATGAFSKLAVAEGKVHHIAAEDVEFHEVGAIDSIVDITGAAIGIDALNIERFACSAINVGSGFVHCQHGILPVPAPATADLLRNATIYSKHANAEMVTPTGAAILASLVTNFSPLAGLAVEAIGYGAGSRQFENFPNCLRLMVGEDRVANPRESAATFRPQEGAPDDIIVMEASIDDMTPQTLAYATDRLLDAGALDVCVIPIQMKKGRAAHLLQVLSPVDRVEPLQHMIFAETTTIGLRYYAAQRATLERSWVSVKTPHGEVRVKVSRLQGRSVNAMPEYEDCVRIAQATGLPLKEIQAQAMRTYLEQAGAIG